MHIHITIIIVICICKIWEQVMNKLVLKEILSKYNITNEVKYTQSFGT